ncbi:hypothetical protein [Polaromonas sp. CG9_12]|nr:hypothetical protein [Polaromonas sp. CG9_12]
MANNTPLDDLSGAGKALKNEIRISLERVSGKPMTPSDRVRTKSFNVFSCIQLTRKVQPHACRFPL